MRMIRREMSGVASGEVVVDVDGRHSLTARIDFEQVSRELSDAEAVDLVLANDSLKEAAVTTGAQSMRPPEMAL